MKILAFIALSVPLTSAFSGPDSIEELVKMAYPDTYQDIEPFKPLPGSPWAYVSGNDSSILRIHDLSTTSYPLYPGEVGFGLENSLMEEFPEGTETQIVFFEGNVMTANTTFDMCQYMVFGELFCPLPKHLSAESINRTLIIPNNVKAAQYSFIATAISPEKKLVARFAAMIDLMENAPVHDEL